MLSIKGRVFTMNATKLDLHFFVFSMIFNGFLKLPRITLKGFYNLALGLTFRCYTNTPGSRKTPQIFCNPCNVSLPAQGSPLMTGTGAEVRG
jgi:hypothetical protein